MTTDVAETTDAKVDSTVETTASTETQELVSQETAVAQSDGAETLETEKTARPPDSYNLEELNQLYGSGKLDNPALVTRRESLIQSANDRWQQEQQTLATQRAADEQRVTELASLKDTTAAQLKANRERMLNSTDPDLELYAEREQAILNDYHAKSEAIHIAPHEAGLRAALLRVHGDTPANRRAVNGRNLPELVSDIWGAAFDAGRRAGPDEGHVVMTKAEFEKAKNDHLDAYKAKNPLPGLVATKGGIAGVGAGDWTYARYMAATPEERRDIAPDVEARIIREESRRRSVR